MLASDFGDAPLPYPTTLLEDGARHEIGGIQLGTRIDSERDGVHSDSADADAGDDGVVIGPMYVGMLDARVNATVVGDAGRLDAWIDFNRDGSFGGPGEQIFAGEPVSAAVNVRQFDVPNFALPGTTFARFRVSKTGGYGVTGAGGDGEVEDYQVRIYDPAEATGYFARHQHIGSAAGVTDVFASDLDDDGDMDVVSAAPGTGIIWHENRGDEGFENHEIAAGGAPVSVFVTDVDGDGDLDVLGALDGTNQINWYENDGDESFSAHVVSTRPASPNDLFALDMDDDGDTDILAAISSAEHEVVWYENDGHESFTEHHIHSKDDEVLSVFAADLDNDGDMDVISGSYQGADKIEWYENNGSESFRPRSIATTADQINSVFVTDLDFDGDMDVLSASQSTDGISWYENDGRESFTQRGINRAYFDGTDLFPSDLDGDGDIDVLASGYDAGVFWFENNGAEDFSVHNVVTPASSIGALGVTAADMDGDGDLDAVSAASLNDAVIWHHNIEYDFGDAPVPYPTTISEDGARHVPRGPQLGVLTDVERDGTHSDDATADGDDEDGVLLDGMIVGGHGTANINVQTAAGKLDGWIDFNHDGSWGGPGEQIFASRDVVVGNNKMAFDVPSYALAGTTIARLRISTAGGLGVTGIADDGEVEDYQVFIDSPAVSSGVFARHVVTDAQVRPNDVQAADIDGDGDQDLLSISYETGDILWHENDGSGDFTDHVVIAGVRIRLCVAPADLDGDGDIDVLASATDGSRVAWYENDGSQNFVQRTLATTSATPVEILVADFGADGDQDVLYASQTGDRIFLHENDGHENFTLHEIHGGFDRPLTAFPINMDGDGDLDIVTTSRNNDTISWLENLGSLGFTEHQIDTSVLKPIQGIATDFDGDGDIDVLGTSYNDDEVLWYENDGAQNYDKHVIGDGRDGALELVAADMDGDGDLDVVNVSSRDDTVVWYENDGTQSFTTHLIDTLADNGSSVIVADLDQDRDLDVVVTTTSDNMIRWYENLGFDFGDAPLPYPTTLAENGPRHIPTGPTLGDRRDAETDTSHSSGADFDGADEDGVSFGALVVGALDASVTVNVQGGPAMLDAWIDFNGDGSWGGPGEQIFDSQTVSVGDNELTFDVPAEAISDITYARFRLSSAGGLGVDGLAGDGEVEDYRVIIQNPVATFPVFAARTISDDVGGATGADAADIDGDGDLDVVSASLDDSTIYWHENLGDLGFATHVVSNNALAARSVFASDVDGDGDMDLLSASYNDHKISWYENDGAQNFDEHVITTSAMGAISVFAADIDADGDVDVLSASERDDVIGWYENDGGQVFAAHTIGTDQRNPRQVIAVDVDGDGDMDVLAASELDDTIGWYENDGEEVFVFHEVTTSADVPYGLYATDVDGDGDMDVLSASFNDDKISWYENDGRETFSEHVVSSTADGAFGVSAADVDGDGDVDLLSVSGVDDKVTWYENDGRNRFTERLITTQAQGANYLTTGDVDNDGDLDVIVTSYQDDKVTIFVNNNPDFGDAPEPYPTTKAEQGAYHTPEGNTLGHFRDRELNGTHSVGADADDLVGIVDDEDGVEFGSVFVGMLDASVTVNVQGDPDYSNYLSAWIDFNKDGSWSGPGEEIISRVSVDVGDNELTFDVPGDALAGTTYARFRLLSYKYLDVNPDHGPIGWWPSGEVEDHTVRIISPPVSSSVFADQYTLTTDAIGASTATAADLDGDGDMDVIGGWDGDDKIVWWENDGSQSYAAHTITTALRNPSSVVVIDVDGDGDLDVLACSSEDDNKISWYENDGAENFVEHVISTDRRIPRSLFAADVDRDGDLDVLSASSGDHTIGWFENDGEQGFTPHEICTDALGATDVYAVDLDGDGDLDVLSASQEDNKIAWYENDGEQGFTAHNIITSAAAASSVVAADLDDDGDMDLVVGTANDSRLFWYENKGRVAFTQHLIIDQIDRTRDVTVADVDGDGDLDILSASSDDDTIGWYENVSRGSFIPHKVTTFADGVTDIAVADTDGDGDLDVIGVSPGNDSVTTYENLGFDFGDAPDGYPVTTKEAGARHVAYGPALGAHRDEELDGTHSANADADDTTGSIPDDEDGVRVTATLVKDDDPTTATLTISSIGDNPYIDFWIDWNRDGDWDDEGEFMTPGDSRLYEDEQTFTFNILPRAAVGPVVSRFRVTSNGILTPGGDALDGEVEDYIFELYDANDQPDVDAHFVHESMTYLVDSGKATFRAGDLTLFSAPVEKLGSINVHGTPAAESLVLDVGEGFAYPVNGYSVGGAGGEDSLVILGDEGMCDLTSDMMQVSNFGRLDLSHDHVNRVKLDAATIAELSPAAPLTIIGGDDDWLVFGDVEDWRMGDPIVRGSELILTANNSAGGGSERIEADMPHPWQNFVRRGDVTNDGAVTALDALNIINELQWRLHSVRETGYLLNPLDVGLTAYFDHTGDDRASALDALRVINDIAREALGIGSGELIVPTPEPPVPPQTTEGILVQPPAVAARASSLRSDPVDDEVQVLEDIVAERTIPGSQIESTDSVFEWLEINQHTSDETVQRSVDRLLSDDSFVDQLLTE